MSKLNFKNEGDEHNFWQNYTDLMLHGMATLR